MIKTIPTHIEGINIEVDHTTGDYRIVDTNNLNESYWERYSSIATLPVDKSLWEDYGKDARWMWATSYWSDVFPTETLLIVHKPMK